MAGGWQRIALVVGPWPFTLRPLPTGIRNPESRIPYRPPATGHRPHARLPAIGPLAMREPIGEPSRVPDLDLEGQDRQWSRAAPRYDELFLDAFCDGVESPV